MTATRETGRGSAPSNPVLVSANLALPDELLDGLAERVAAVVLSALAAAGPASSPWLDVAGAADYLCCKPKRLHDLVSQGRVPHYREGGRLVFRRDELDEWITSGRARDTRVTPTADRQCSSPIGEAQRMRDPRVHAGEESSCR